MVGKWFRRQLTKAMAIYVPVSVTHGPGDHQRRSGGAGPCDDHDARDDAGRRIGGGFVTVVFFSFWGRAYGPAELGRIQGAAQAMTVLSSVLGSLLLALCVEWTGSYSGAFYALAVVTTVIGAAALGVPMPAGTVSRSVARGTRA